MGKNAKSLLKISFLSFFFLLSCEKEINYEEETKKDNNISVSFKEFEDFQNNDLLVRKLFESKQKISMNSPVSRANDENELNLENAVYLLDEYGNHSYIFYIENGESEKVDNLVLSSKYNGDYESRVFSYNLTETDKLNINAGTTVDLSNKTEILTIEEYNLNVTNNLASCWELVEIQEINPCAIDGCWDSQYTSISLSYSWIYTCGGGGGSSGSGDSGGGNSGGGISGGGGAVNVSLILQNLSPCNKLKDLLKTPQPNIKAIIQNQLQTDIPINPNGEKAAFIQKLPNGTMGSTITPPTNTGSVKILTGTNVYSAIHTHNNNLYPMFSWSDVLVLHTINKNIKPHNAGLSSFLLVCQDDNGAFQTYAIVFNFETFNYIDAILNSPSFAGVSHADIAREMDAKITKKFDKEFDDGTKNYERAFLEQFKDMNVSLYKANANLTNWSRVRLNTATNNTQEEPCN